MPESGIYQALHRRHRSSHPVIGIQGERFPACRTCGAQVIFELVEAVPHATHDWDFAGPGPMLVKDDKQKRKKA